MRGVKASVFIIFSALLGAGIAFGVQQEASVEKGKALFSDPKLGTTGKSCNDCHPGGKGADKGAAKPDLEDILNGCITQGLKGKALDVKPGRQTRSKTPHGMLNDPRLESLLRLQEAFFITCLQYPENSCPCSRPFPKL